MPRSTIAGLSPCQRSASLSGEIADPCSLLCSTPPGADLSLVRELSVPEYLGRFLSFAARSSSVNILVCTWFSFIFEYIFTRFLEVGFLGQK